MQCHDAGMSEPVRDRGYHRRRLIAPSPSSQRRKVRLVWGMDDDPVETLAGLPDTGKAMDLSDRVVIMHHVDQVVINIQLPG